MKVTLYSNEGTKGKISRNPSIIEYMIRVIMKFLSTFIKALSSVF